MTEVPGVRSWPDDVPKLTLGWAALEWTGDYLLQPDGPDAGNPWAYTDEQVRIVLRWYAIDDTGRFVYRRGVLRRMKGWGKDPFLASLALVELCGPCRFGGWKAPGVPIVVQHPSPWIQVAAVSRDQTRNTMTLFPGMMSPALKAEYGVDPGKEIIYARGGARIEAVTSSPRALEGGRPSLVIANETHHWLANNEGLAMAQVIARNLAKSRDAAGRVMEITNAHLPGEGSAAEESFEAWRASGAPDVYYDSLEAPPIETLEDPDEVADALRAARGDSVWLGVERLAAEIADPKTPETESRRFYLNQVTGAGAEWIDAKSWDARMVTVPSDGEFIPKNTAVVLGFDGSSSGDGDATALVVCTIPKDKHEPVFRLDVADLWESLTDVIPILDVEDAIRAACRRWRVREVACDPYRWGRTIAVLTADRIPMVEFPQRPERMIPASERFFEATMGGMIEHTGNKDLARHIANCKLKVSHRGSRIEKDSKSSPRHIDLAIASVMAVERAAHFAGRGAPQVIDLRQALLDADRDRG